MSDSHKQHSFSLKKAGIIAAIAVFAILSGIVAASYKPNQIAESQTEENNVAAKNVFDKTGFYFNICGDEVDPTKALGTPQDPIVVKQGNEEAVDVQFCGTSTVEKNATWLLKLASENNVPISLSRDNLGITTGDISKGISVKFDRDFIDVPATTVDAATKTVISPSKMTFSVKVNVAKDAEAGTHLFFVFVSKPNTYGGNTEIGKAIAVKIVP